MVETFQQQWFHGAGEDEEVRARQLVLVVWQVYSQLKATGQVSLPLANTFPPVDLFTRLLAGTHLNPVMRIRNSHGFAHETDSRESDSDSQAFLTM